MTGGDSFPSSAGCAVVEAMVATIDANAALLSEIDGAIGDGDHGINMRKGFLLAREALPAGADLSTGLEILGDALLTKIGGAMGPLYGTFFVDMADACAGAERIDAAVFGHMLAAGHDSIVDLGGASVGDKTLLDTLAPAVAAYQAALDEGASFDAALRAMVRGAEQGKESTRDLVARVGRASRLGERSRGALDAGATSSWLLLAAIADSMGELLRQEG